MTETDKKARRPGRRFSILALLGGLMMLVSLIGIYSEPDLLQYAFLPAAGDESAQTVPETASGSESSTEEDDLDAEEESRTSGSGSAPTVFSAARDALTRFDTFASSSVWAGEDLSMTLQGQKASIPVFREGGGSESDVRLILVGPRFQEVFPRKMLEGSAISNYEVSQHQRSAVLDSRLAFSLFGDQSPIGQTVEIAGSEYTVVGVAQHARSLGAGNELTAWVPLGADPALASDLITVSVRHSRASDGFSTLWRSEAESAFGSGTFLSLPQEKNRASLLPRLLIFFFAAALLKRWIRLLRAWGARFLRDARERVSRQYAFSLTGYFLLRILAALLLSAATLAAMYALAVFITEPLLVFPEWVPEKPVALSSILARFWSLIAQNATPVSLLTEQAAVLRFWRFWVRLGTFLLLLGLLKPRLRPVSRQD